MWTSGIVLVALVGLVSTASFESGTPNVSWLKSKLAQLELKLGAGTSVAPATASPATVTTQKPTSAPTTQAPADACDAIFSCSDCSTARICRPNMNGGFTQVRTISCPSNTPYCDYNTGTCTTIPSAQCGATDDEFLCLQNGTFPDFHDSSVYHVCDDLTPHKFSCATPGEIFDAVTSTCTAAQSFTTFKCTDAGKKVPYNISATYYGYCSEGVSQPVVIDKCPGTYQLNVTSQQCEAICHEPGVLPYITDCSKYYKCDYLWINDTESFLLRTVESCPADTTFSADDFICVEKSLNPNCPTD